MAFMSSKKRVISSSCLGVALSVAARTIATEQEGAGVIIYHSAPASVSYFDVISHPTDRAGVVTMAIYTLKTLANIH